VSTLAGTFSGQLLGPNDPGYDEARKVHNGLIDKRPALIAQCRGVADIVDAVKLSRDQNSKSPSGAAATTSPGARRPTAA